MSKGKKKREQEKFGYNNIKRWAVHRISFRQTWTAGQMDMVIPVYPPPIPNSNFVLWNLDSQTNGHGDSSIPPSPPQLQLCYVGYKTKQQKHPARIHSNFTTTCKNIQRNIQFQSQRQQKLPKTQLVLTLDRIFVCDSDLGKLLATSITFLSSWIPDFTSARRRCSLADKINPTKLVSEHSQQLHDSRSITTPQRPKQKWH